MNIWGRIKQLFADQVCESRGKLESKCDRDCPRMILEDQMWVEIR